ncbi:MAG: Na+/H+ antiporter NhaC family protein [Lachnospiraceae bacterium]|nr:Na+/H+ antiporter NhaC family protein [Lachnospiraceae bacterium]
MKLNRRIWGYIFLVVCLIVVALFAPTGADYYGAWSLLPAAAIFIFILLTKGVIEGFLWVGVLAVFIKYRWEFFTTYCGKLSETIQDGDNVYLILVFLLLGVLITFLKMSGAATYFARKVATKAKSSRAALLLTWVMSWILSVDDYLNAFVTGAAMSPVTDEYKIPREATAYVIRSSAVHTSSIIPIGSWVIFGATLLETNNFAAGGTGVTEYMKCVPFMFYCFVSLLFGFLFCMGWLPKFGMMKKAYQRVEAGGSTLPKKEAVDGAEVDEEEAIEPRKGVNMLSFLIPIVSMVGFCVYFDFDMQLGLTLAIFVTGALFVVQKIFKSQRIFSLIIEGFNGMMEMTFLLVIGFTMTGTVSELGFTEFVVGATQNIVNPALLPFIIFLLFSATEFLVTFNWTLYMMVMPSIIALSQATGANVYLCLAAMFCAGLFGSNSSFASDAGMCNAAATGLDLYDHNMCCMQYSIPAFIIAALLYLISGFIF